MARVVFHDEKLKRLMIPELEAAGLEALVLYKRHRRAKNSPSNPFEDKPGTRRAGVVRRLNGVRVFVESPGALFEEEGNDKQGDEIRPNNSRDRLWLRLKNENPSGLGSKAKAAIRKGKDGKFYLVLKKVRSYSGRHYFEQALREAFRLTRV